MSILEDWRAVSQTKIREREKAERYGMWLTKKTRKNNSILNGRPAGNFTVDPCFFNCWYLTKTGNMETNVQLQPFNKLKSCYHGNAHLSVVAIREIRLIIVAENAAFNNILLKGGRERERGGVGWTYTEQRNNTTGRDIQRQKKRGGKQEKRIVGRNI